MTFPQCWHNVENNVISQCSQNVQATLCECFNIGVQCWNLTKSQHSHNVVTTLWHYNNIVTPLPECSVNIVAQPKYQLHTTLYQCWESTWFSKLSKHCYNIGETHQESEIWFPILKIKCWMIGLIHFNWWK